VRSPLALTDPTGELTHRVVAGPRGTGTIDVMDPLAAAPAVGFSSTLTAFDAAGTVHMRARDYDPSVGAFTTVDPWQRPDGSPWVDVYQYTDGDPVMFWDPTGLAQTRTRPGGTCGLGPFTLPTAFGGSDGTGCKGGVIGRRFDTSVQVCVPFELSTNCWAVGQQGGNFYYAEGRGVRASAGIGAEFVPIDYRDRSCRNVGVNSGASLSGGQDGKFPFDVGVGAGLGPGASVAEWYATDGRYCNGGYER
jgi:RHS repeat-associated protein